MDDRVYVHVLGLPSVYKLKISRSSPLRHLFAHIPYQSFAPPLAVGIAEFYWNDVKLDPGLTAADYDMAPGEGNAHIVHIHYPLASPKAAASAAARSAKPVTSASASTSAFTPASSFAAPESPLGEAPRAQPAPVPFAALDRVDGALTPRGTPLATQRAAAPPASSALVQVQGALGGAAASADRPSSPISHDLLTQYVRNPPAAVSAGVDPTHRIAEENRALKEQLHESDAALESAMRDAETLTAKVAELRRSSERTVSEERAAREAAERRAEELAARVAEAEGTLLAERERLATTERELEKLRQQRSVADRHAAENDVLRRELDEASRRADEFRDSAEAARQRVRDLELRERDAALHASRTQDSRSADELAQLRHHVAGVEAKIGARDAEIEQFKQLVREKDRDVQRLHVEVNDRDAKLRAAVKKAEEDAAALDGYMGQIEATQRELEALRRERAELTDQCQRYLDEAKAASSNALRFQEKLSVAEREADALRAALESAETRLADESRDGRKTQAALAAERERLEAAARRAAGQAAQAEDEVAKLRAKLVRVSESAAAFEKDSDAALAEARAETERERAEVHTLRQELTAQREAADKLERVREEERAAAAADAQRLLDELRDELEDARQIARQRQDATAELETALVECNESMMRLRRENNELRAQLRDLYPSYHHQSGAQQQQQQQQQHRFSGQGTDSRYVQNDRVHWASLHPAQPPPQPQQQPPQAHPRSISPRRDSPSYHYASDGNSRSSSIGSSRPVVVIRDARVSVVQSTAAASNSGALGNGHVAGNTAVASFDAYAYPEVSTSSPRVGRARVPRSTSVHE